MAQQPAGIVRQFMLHLDTLFGAMQKEQQLVQYRSKSGGLQGRAAHSSRSALLPPPVVAVQHCVPAWHP